MGGGHHGGHHGGFHGRGGFGGVVYPWGWDGWGWDVPYDPSLYQESPTIDDVAEAVAAKLKEKKATVGDDVRDGSAYDCLGAETLCGQDWLNVAKGALASIASGGDVDKKRAEEKAKAEKKAAEASATLWRKIAIGGAIVGGILGLIFLGRR